jgi:hypothetical protein
MPVDPITDEYVEYVRHTLKTREGQHTPLELVAAHLLARLDLAEAVVRAAEVIHTNMGPYRPPLEWDEFEESFAEWQGAVIGKVGADGG